MKEMDEKDEQKKQHRRLALAKLLIPICLFCALWLIIGLCGPETVAKFVTVFSVYTFSPVANAVVVIPTGLGLGIPPVALIAFLVSDDALVSLFLVWNFDYALRIPGIGKVVEKAVKGGEKALKKHKLLERLGFAGLFVFVMFPLIPSGAVWASIIGRLMGMKPLLTFIAVVLGSFTRFAIEILIFM